MKQELKVRHHQELKVRDNFIFLQYRYAEGQLVLKCPFSVIVLTKMFLRISVLASKKRLNQKKTKALYLLIFNYLRNI